MKTRKIKIGKKKNTIETLLKSGKNVSEIASILGISRQSVFYHKKTMNKPRKARKLKLNKKHINQIIKCAEGKQTGRDGVSSRKIKNKICAKFRIKIGHCAVNRILNEKLSKPRKVRKVFFLNNDQKKKGKNFAIMSYQVKLMEIISCLPMNRNLLSPQHSIIKRIWFDFPRRTLKNSKEEMKIK